MPLYVRAGTVLPLAQVRQYTGQEVDEPMTLRMYPGRDGHYTLYEDDGQTLDYRDGEATWIRFAWDDDARTLILEPGRSSTGQRVESRRFRVVLVGEDDDPERTVTYTGEPMTVSVESSH